MVEENAMSDRAAFAVIGLVSLVVVGLVGALMAGGGGARPAAFDVSALPLVNACLNTLSAGFLVAGWIFIRRRHVPAHVTCMLAAFAVSTLFLLSYVTYHYHAGSRPFTGQGWIRPLYFALLITHIVLAAVILPLILATLHRAWRRAFDRHRRLARVTLPLWLYVSVTGVLVYWLLYH
jgi:putative membrane protein